ncbi:hypothetical protein M514_04527, partial [Trichuris suis]
GKACRKRSLQTCNLLSENFCSDRTPGTVPLASSYVSSLLVQSLIPATLVTWAMPTEKSTIHTRCPRVTSADELEFYVDLAINESQRWLELRTNDRCPSISMPSSKILLPLQATTREPFLNDDDFLFSLRHGSQLRKIIEFLLPRSFSSEEVNVLSTQRKVCYTGEEGKFKPWTNTFCSVCLRLGIDQQNLFHPNDLEESIPSDGSAKGRCNPETLDRIRRVSGIAYTKRQCCNCSSSVYYINYSKEQIFVVVVTIYELACLCESSADYSGPRIDRTAVEPLLFCHTESLSSSSSSVTTNLDTRKTADSPTKTTQEVIESEESGCGSSINDPSQHSSSEEMDQTPSCRPDVDPLVRDKVTKYLTEQVVNAGTPAEDQFSESQFSDNTFRSFSPEEFDRPASSASANINAAHPRSHIRPLTKPVQCDLVRHDPHRFVASKPATLAQRAVSQLQLIDLEKKARSSRVIVKDDEVDWLANLNSWKLKRRAMNHGKPNQESRTREGETASSHSNAESKQLPCPSIVVTGSDKSLKALPQNAVAVSKAEMHEEEFVRKKCAVLVEVTQEMVALPKGTSDANACRKNIESMTCNRISSVDHSDHFGSGSRDVELESSVRHQVGLTHFRIGWPGENGHFVRHVLADFGLNRKFWSPPWNAIVCRTETRSARPIFCLYKLQLLSVKRTIRLTRPSPLQTSLKGSVPVQWETVCVRLLARSIETTAQCSLVYKLMKLLLKDPFSHITSYVSSNGTADRAHQSSLVIRPGTKATDVVSVDVEQDVGRSMTWTSQCTNQETNVSIQPLKVTRPTVVTCAGQRDKGSCIDSVNPPSPSRHLQVTLRQRAKQDRAFGFTLRGGKNSGVPIQIDSVVTGLSVNKSCNVSCLFYKRKVTYTNEKELGMQFVIHFLCAFSSRSAVLFVFIGSPADLAGLKPGYTVTAINGLPVESDYLAKANMLIREAAVVGELDMSIRICTAGENDAKLEKSGNFSCESNSELPSAEANEGYTRASFERRRSRFTGSLTSDQVAQRNTKGDISNAKEERVGTFSKQLTHRTAEMNKLSYGQDKLNFNVQNDSEAQASLLRQPPCMRPLGSSSSADYRVVSMHEQKVPGKISDFVPEYEREAEHSKYDPTFTSPESRERSSDGGFTEYGHRGTVSGERPTLLRNYDLSTIATNLCSGSSTRSTNETFHETCLKPSLNIKDDKIGSSVVKYRYGNLSPNSRSSDAGYFLQDLHDDVNGKKNEPYHSVCSDKMFSDGLKQAYGSRDAASPIRNIYSHWMVREAERKRLSEQLSTMRLSDAHTDFKGGNARGENGLTKSEPQDEELISVSAKHRCSHCGEELGRGCAMSIESLALFYHLQCFKCHVCGVSLGDGAAGADVRVRSNKLHCQSCYSNDEAGYRLSEV